MDGRREQEVPRIPRKKPFDFWELWEGALGLQNKQDPQFLHLHSEALPMPQPPPEDASETRDIDGIITHIKVLLELAKDHPE